MTTTATDVLRGVALDRTSPVPLHAQVGRALEDAIVSGRLASGSLLENEVRLAASLGLSRPTMRHALQYLVDRGLVVRRRGVGTRVVPPMVRRPLELSSLYDDLAHGGRVPETRVLALDVGPATPAVADALGLDDAAPVTCVVRLRSAGNLLVAKMTNYLPADLLPEVSRDDLERSGLYALLRAAGVRLHSASQTVGARTASTEEARLLGERRGAALLTMERIAYDDHGRAVELGSHVYAASRYSFEMSLFAR